MHMNNSLPKKYLSPDRRNIQTDKLDLKFGLVLSKN